MEQNLYEHHAAKENSIPFIFHHQTLEKNEVSFSNWHKNIEFLYITKGSGNVYIAAQQYVAEEGNIFVINSYLPHYTSTVNGMEYYYLITESEFCNFNGLDTINTVFVPLIKDSFAQKLYTDTISSFSITDSYRDITIKSSVLSFLAYITRNYTTENVKDKRIISSAEAIRLGVGYILANIDKHLSTEQLSRQVGLSKYYFVREFKRHLGITPIEFIHKNRCEIAKKLLKTNKYSIGEICQKAGFDSTSYFTKIFKRNVGQTPSAYRAAHIK